jgi:hypothetical protein
MAEKDEKFSPEETKQRFEAGYRSRRLQAFQDDPQLLIIRPAPPSAGLNDLKPLNLSTVLMAVHKYCYTSLNLTNKVAAAGGIRNNDIGEMFDWHFLAPIWLPNRSRRGAKRCAAVSDLGTEISGKEMKLQGDSVSYVKLCGAHQKIFSRLGEVSQERG